MADGSTGQNVRARVLVVDGDPGTLKTMETELTRRGYRVRAAWCDAAALDAVNEDTFDVIVAEIFIREKGGFWLLNEVRSSPTTAAVPFIFLTSDRTLESKLRGLELGVDDYITKPCEFVEFSARLDAMIRRRARDDEASARDGEPPGGWGLAGKLSCLRVSEVLRMLSTNRKTGLLRVHSHLDSGEIRGEVFFENGKVRHAMLPGIAGGADVITLLSDMEEGPLRSATFDFQPGVRPPMETVGVPPEDLLLTAAKEADHMERAKKSYRRKGGD